MHDKFASIRVQILRIRDKFECTTRRIRHEFAFIQVLTPRIRQEIASIRVQTRRIPVKFASIRI